MYSQQEIIPRKHQQKAIQLALNYYKNNNRGKLILPCGTGKTLTALWIKEALEKENIFQKESSTVLILLPSLMLVKQFKETWQENTKQVFDYLCVCSDASVNIKTNKQAIEKRTIQKEDENEEDEFILSLEEVETHKDRVTTNSDKILIFLERNTPYKIIFQPIILYLK